MVQQQQLRLGLGRTVSFQMCHPCPRPRAPDPNAIRDPDPNAICDPDPNANGDPDPHAIRDPDPNANGDREKK